MKSVFVGLVMLAASVSGIAAVTVLQDFNTVTSEALLGQGFNVTGGLCQMGIGTGKNPRVGFTMNESASFGELLSGEVKFNKPDGSLADPYTFFLVDTNKNGTADISQANSDYLFMLMNPTYSEPDDNGWTKLSFDLNSTFSASLSMDSRTGTQKTLSEWLAQYGDCQILRYYVGYNLQVKKTGRCDVDDLQFKYGTPDVGLDPDEPVPATVPVPGAVVLASLGLGVVRYMRGRVRI
ncbi:MAG: hypothetical protein JXB18_06860 [Sedimentisphaerales bacterium]|nr:hypothetical protein [Sedimentisphaerales bacterium]